MLMVSIALGLQVFLNITDFGTQSTEIGPEFLSCLEPQGTKP